MVEVREVIDFRVSYQCSVYECELYSWRRSCLSSWFVDPSSIDEGRLFRYHTRRHIQREVGPVTPADGTSAKNDRVSVVGVQWDVNRRMWSMHTRVDDGMTYVELTRNTQPWWLTTGVMTCSNYRGKSHGETKTHRSVTFIIVISSISCTIIMIPITSQHPLSNDIVKVIYIQSAHTAFGVVHTAATPLYHSTSTIGVRNSIWRRHSLRVVSPI